MKFSPTSNWAFIGGGTLLFLAAIVVLWPFGFSFDSICSQCGARQNTYEWQLPFSRSTIFAHSTVKTTLLSSYLTSSGMVTNHSHQWLFGHGGGNGIKCAIGNGDHLRQAIEAPELIRLLAASRQFGNQEEGTNFLKLALNWNSTRDVLNLGASIPTNGFPNQQQYRNWMSDQAWLIDEATQMANKTNEW